MNTYRTLPSVCFLLLFNTLPPALADVENMNPHSAEHFPMADADEDGMLNLEEFKNFVRLEAEDGVGKSKNIKRFGVYGRAFNTLDANADEMVTREEIAEFQSK